MDRHRAGTRRREVVREEGRGGRPGGALSSERPQHTQVQAGVEAGRGGAPLVERGGEGVQALAVACRHRSAAVQVVRGPARAAVAGDHSRSGAGVAGARALVGLLPRIFRVGRRGVPVGGQQRRHLPLLVLQLLLLRLLLLLHGLRKVKRQLRLRPLVERLRLRLRSRRRQRQVLRGVRRRGDGLQLLLLGGRQLCIRNTIRRKELRWRQLSGEKRSAVLVAGAVAVAVSAAVLVEMAGRAAVHRHASAARWRTVAIVSSACCGASPSDRGAPRCRGRCSDRGSVRRPHESGGSGLRHPVRDEELLQGVADFAGVVDVVDPLVVECLGRLKGSCDSLSLRRVVNEPEAALELGGLVDGGPLDRHVQHCAVAAEQGLERLDRHQVVNLRPGGRLETLAAILVGQEMGHRSPDRKCRTRARRECRPPP